MKASVRLVRFATIGTLNYLITMLVIWIVMSYFSFKGKYIVANIMAYLIAQTHNFIWSKYWIFPSSNPQNNILKIPTPFIVLKKAVQNNLLHIDSYTISLLQSFFYILFL